jgi:hypothetical protein
VKTAKVCEIEGYSSPAPARPSPARNLKYLDVIQWMDTQLEMLEGKQSEDERKISEAAVGERKGRMFRRGCLSETG